MENGREKQKNSRHTGHAPEKEKKIQVASHVVKQLIVLTTRLAHAREQEILNLRKAKCQHF